MIREYASVSVLPDLPWVTHLLILILIVILTPVAVALIYGGGWFAAVGLDGVYRWIVGEPAITLKVRQQTRDGPVLVTGTVLCRGKPAPKSTIWLTWRCDTDIEGVWGLAAQLETGRDGEFSTTLPARYACPGDWKAAYSRPSPLTGLSADAHARFDPVR